jgi:hypothetical protein
MPATPRGEGIIYMLRCWKELHGRVAARPS